MTDHNGIFFSNKTKDLVIALKKLKAFDSSYVQGKSYFEDDGIENWLAFQPMQRYFELVIDNPSIILSWESKGLSDELIISRNKICNTLQNMLVLKRE